MKVAAVSPVVRSMRELDRRWQRAWRPGVRDVLFDARTSMEYGMMAPVHRRLVADERVRAWLVSSERPERAGAIFRDAPGDAPVISPRRALMRRFDACLAADFVWATLPRGTCRIQMFHGVAGKWSRVYDRPDRSMRQWDRLFFINRRRLQNYIASGAIDGSSPAIRLVGMPKSDCLVDGSLTRNAVLETNGMDPALTTVMYAPTWTRYSSLNAMGEDVVRLLIDAGYRVLVKLHDNSLDRKAVNSGGIDWVARLEPILARGHGHLITSGDASPWLVATDVLITDHSSIGFEYLLLDRPLIRIAMPDLITGADIATEYVTLMASASTTVDSAAGVRVAVERAVAHPSELSGSRRALAAELFHEPGTATDRAVNELYDLMELDLPTRVQPTVPVQANVYG
jgi:CDP-glycerol:poly(glycerophosphate) glycerophosphotransferase